MNILVVGGSGFLGRHLLPRLLEAGHVLRATYNRRQPTACTGVEWKRLDLNLALQPTAWRDLVADVDVVINLAGVLRETRRNKLDLVHALAPLALYQAARAAGVVRAIHISALGAGANANSQYHRTKYAGERALRHSGLDWTILRPSLVYGPDGDSTRQFSALTRLPLTPLYRAGSQLVQPLHIDDLVELVAMLINGNKGLGEIIDVVGEQPIDMRAYYRLFRRQQGVHPDRFLNVPGVLVRVSAGIGKWWDRSPLCPDTLTMLGEDNVGDPRRFVELLGRTPRSVGAFFQPERPEISQCPGSGGSSTAC